MLTTRFSPVRPLPVQFSRQKPSENRHSVLVGGEPHVRDRNQAILHAEGLKQLSPSSAENILAIIRDPNAKVKVLVVLHDTDIHDHWKAVVEEAVDARERLGLEKVIITAGGSARRGSFPDEVERLIKYIQRPFYSNELQKALNGYVD